jgi:uncharacterized repeat protein (TIGR03803 family)
MKHQRTVISAITAALLFAVVPATAQTGTYKSLFNYPFSNGSSGINNASWLSQGRDGNLYSTIEPFVAGETNGSVYRMTTSGGYTLLYSFCKEGNPCATTGSQPSGGVTLGFDGNLWGTTEYGGPSTDAECGGLCGTVFYITPTTEKWHLVYSFTNDGDGAFPIYPVLQGQDGNMYGVSEQPSDGRSGAFYKLTTKGKIKAAQPFPYSNGPDPNNLPAQGVDLNFYGTTAYGGSGTCEGGCGVVYKATAAGSPTVLHNFTGWVSSTVYDGSEPYHCVLVQGPDGYLYGTTYAGGEFKDGTVFRILPSGDGYALLHSFPSATGDGEFPYSGLTLGTDGNLYGTTYEGGTAAGGTIFQITPAGDEKVLYSFCSLTCDDGFYPQTPMVLHTDGTFYGNTVGNDTGVGSSVFYRFDVGFKPFVKLVTWSAEVGAAAQILGQGFTGATGVSFSGGVAATFDNSSDTYMTATVPAGALTGAVTVTTFTGTLSSDRSFLVVPQIKSFSPGSGVVGTPVIITGVSLTQTIPVTGVTIGTKAAKFVVDSDTQVTATVPAGAKTGKAITIATLGGTVSSADKFVVEPLIRTFSPGSGPVGTTVTITGHTFTGTTKVTFGGVAATSYQAISDTEVKALVPLGAVTGPIAVTTPGGTGTSTTNFTVTQ